MNQQKIFNYQFNSINDHENYFVNETNQKAYDISNLEKFNQNIFLFGPPKSGKSFLANLWKYKNNAISYNNNFSTIIESKKNILIDDLLGKSPDENFFHLINHCKLNNLKMYFVSSLDINTYNFKFLDLSFMNPL